MSLASASLLISGLAILVSCFAAAVSWRAYRQAGARVAADLVISEPSHTADHDVIVAGYVQLSISNKGLAAIGINHAIWLIQRTEGTLVAMVASDGSITPSDGGITPSGGPELPMTLSGLHSAHWSFDFDELVNRVETGHARAQVIFSLGDREVSTPWRSLPGKDSVTVR
jgi:hypothetical protein